VTKSKDKTNKTLGAYIQLEFRFKAMLYILDEAARRVENLQSPENGQSRWMQMTARLMQHCSATTSSQRTGNALKSGKSSGVA
jgi:hypothetical protein